MESNNTISAELLGQTTDDAKRWADAALAAGWLSEGDVDGLSSLSGETSADLFAEGAAEPLVVALFGGTGVGKSSLLNRLVGESIAKVGVIRPTSLEATVYVHESVEFAGPERAGFQRALHTNDARRHVVWVDMPDVDSTAAHNRELVLSFLPFVDVLVYVVSPERYRDESPWALLREYAERSAWVFVMNQIDRGQQAQLDDLSDALGNAGFEDPVLFATSCGAETALDQFGALAQFIDSLQEQRVREALQEEGRSARLRLLGRRVKDTTADWPQDGSELLASWKARRSELSRELSQDLVERLAPVAARMSKGEAAAPGELWDDWASDRVSDALAATKLDALDVGWCQQSLAQLDTVVDSTLNARGEGALRESVQKSLARPGNAIQRGIYAACGWLQYGLPLLAVLWVGWFVFRGFYSGATGSGAFVAEGFAVNAILLVGLASGLPWLLGRLVKPSPRKAALLGVRRGLDNILEYIDEQTTSRLEQAAKQLAELSQVRDDLSSATFGKASSDEPRGTKEAAALNTRLRRNA